LRKDDVERRAGDEFRSESIRGEPLRRSAHTDGAGEPNRPDESHGKPDDCGPGDGAMGQIEQPTIVPCRLALSRGSEKL
jgi:hypothetical protein